MFTKDIKAEVEALIGIIEKANGDVKEAIARLRAMKDRATDQGLTTTAAELASIIVILKKVGDE